MGEGGGVGTESFFVWLLPHFKPSPDLYLGEGVRNNHIIFFTKGWTI